MMGTNVQDSNERSTHKETVQTNIVAKKDTEPLIIKKLDEVVVNRIAAGEIIHRPANAIKELLENSLDAGSTSINVVAKAGGLKVLQISDNGCGIKREDLSIVCERFTTSKLSDFEDLKSIATFGFRGEALASITHVAHVTISTRTKSAKCAFRATYSDGRLVSNKSDNTPEPKPCAGNPGTTILVEDLFYNMTVRRKALRSAPEEYAKIVEVISRYAVHNSGVAFSVKKQGEMSVDMRTSERSSRLDNIRTIYGAKLAKELLPISKYDSELQMSLTGLVSNANYSVKKGTFIFFINHRLVDCGTLKKGVETIYALHLPKNAHPFVYISIELPPQSIDVNVHPTKQEVHFLNEESVVEAIQNVLTDALLAADKSRTYYAQTRLTGSVVDEHHNVPTQEKHYVATKPYENKMIRTDASSQTLDAFVKANPSLSTSQFTCTEMETTLQELDCCDAYLGMDHHSGSEGAALSNKRIKLAKGTLDKRGKSVEGHSCTTNSQTSIGSTTATERPRCVVRLSSVLQLRSEITQACNAGILDMFRKHTFVGIVKYHLALIQYKTKLYLVNTTALSKALFYQLVFKDFQNFGSIRLSTPADIKILLDLALSDPTSGFSEEEYGSSEHMIANVYEELMSKRGILLEYFSIEITDEGKLSSLPLILKDYEPDFHRLPMFILRLATEVEWSSEEDCFRTLANEICIFYQFRQSLRSPARRSEPDEETLSSQHSISDQETMLTTEAPEVDNTTNDTEGLSGSAGTNSWQWIVEHVLYPSFKRHLQPPSTFKDDETIVLLADLPDLYRVFERC
eukprot:CFRG0590T1